MDPVYNEIALVSRMAQDDITKFHLILDIPYLEVLDELSYMKNRDELIQKENNIREAQQGARPKIRPRK